MARKLLQTFTEGAYSTKIYKDSDTDEFVVRFYTSGKLHENSDYFADEISDAVGTAKAMLQAKRERDNAQFHATRENPAKRTTEVHKVLQYNPRAKSLATTWKTIKTFSTYDEARKYALQHPTENPYESLRVMSTGYSPSHAAKLVRKNPTMRTYADAFKKSVKRGRKPAKAKTPEMHKRECRYTLDKKVTGNTWMMQWQSGDKSALMSMARLMHRDDKANGKRSVYRVYDHGA